MKISLEENIKKQMNLLNEIRRLSEPSVFYAKTYSFRGYGNRYDNKKHLRKVLKKSKRLSVVIKKQALEKARN